MWNYNLLKNPKEKGILKKSKDISDMCNLLDELALLACDFQKDKLLPLHTFGANRLSKMYEFP